MGDTTRRSLIRGRIRLRGRALGAKRALLTDGKVGAYALIDDEVTFCPALKTEVVGTAGAGDAFVSTFTVQIAGGAPVPHALRAATIFDSLSAENGPRFLGLELVTLAERARRMAGDPPCISTPLEASVEHVLPFRIELVENNP